MPVTAAINQPTYLPWLGYFEQIARVDVFVFLDSVQFVKQSWHCRNRLKRNRGQSIWLTVPVKAHPLNTPMTEIQISPDKQDWKRVHLRTIQMCLGKAPYFDRVFPLILKWLTTEYKNLVDLNITGIKLFSDMLGLTPIFLRSSALNSQGHKTNLGVNICSKIDADQFYCSLGSQVYMKKELFLEADIQLNFQSWEHPSYPQQGRGFISHLSVIDALMNIGPEATRSLLMSNIVSKTC